MSNFYPLFRKSAARVHASVNLLTLGSFLLVLALADAAFSADGPETRITTLLPTSTVCKESVLNNNWKTVETKVLSVADLSPSNLKKACSLEFSTEAIPDAAQIKSAALRLVQMGQQPNTSPLVINVHSIAKDEDWTKDPMRYGASQGGIGIIRSPEVITENAVDVWRSESPVFQYMKGQTGKYITLLLYPRKSGSLRNYYPATGNTTNDPSNQPRLILTYTVPRSPVPRSPDSQADGRVAMRSPRAFISTSAPTSYIAMEVVDQNISSYTAAIYGGLVHVIRKYPDGRHLDAQEALGQLVWSKKLPSTEEEKARLVVNDSGRLTIVIRNHFIVYQLNATDPRQPPSDPPKDATNVPGVKAPDALSAAPDGTLYVIDDTDIYALNPDFQMLWRTGIGTSEKARMTLSPDGQFVYAAGLLPDGNNKKAKLLAINAQTGTSTELPNKSAFPKASKVFENPVVVRHPDGADYIYVAANSQSNGVLKTIKNEPQGEIGDRIAALSQVKEENGLFSQPAPDSTVPPAKGDLSAKKLYVVWQDKEKQPSPIRLVSINGQSGAIEDRDTPAITDLASVADGSWLWNGGNPVIDHGGNVVFWANKRLFAYVADNKQLFAAEIPSLPEELELFFGTDGALYVTDKAGALWALVPQYNLDKLVNQTATTSISSWTNLRVEGTVAKETILSAGGSVILGTNFKVNEKTTLKISTGVPYK